MLAASLAALASCFAGMAALSLAMDRHYQQVAGRSEPPRPHRMALRTAGWLLLAISLWPCIAGWGSSVGLVAWCGFLTAGALLVAWTLPYVPRLTIGAAAVTGACAVLALIVV
jgi:hypothetical protein